MNTSIQFPEVKPLNINRYSRIISTSAAFPDNVVTNEDIINQFDIIATDRAVQYSLGIKERRWSKKGQKLEDLMAEATTKCLDEAGISINQVDRVIYAKLFGDFNIPATSIGLLKKLRAKTGVPAFDISCACSGFIHAIDLAMRFIATGDDYVLIVGGNMIGKCTYHWKVADSNTLFLFGDAIVAMLIGRSEIRHFLSSYIMTNSELYENVVTRCGTDFLRTGVKDIHPRCLAPQMADGRVILESSSQYAQVIADKLLEDSGLTIEDIDFFVTSDQSSKVWEGQLQRLNIPKEKSVSMFHKYGNTIAALSPLNLIELIQSGRLKRDHLVMMQAHGAGASSGGLLFRY